jgi:hypothetical protein
MASPQVEDDLEVNINEGWIRLYRKSLSNGWLQNHKLWVLWTYCLLKASHKEHKVMIGNQQVTLQPGQFIFGRKKAAKETGLSEQQIRTSLVSLRTLENLTIKSTNKFSVITVINWELYQNTDEVVTSKVTSTQPTTNHIQECKNEKNKRICASPPSSNGKDPRVKPLIDHFFLLCKEKLDREPTIEGKKDGAAIKRTLQKFDEEQIKNLFDFYVDSPKAHNNGLSIAVALSNHSISEYEQKGRWRYEG